jgi:hypothetical protein
MSRQPLTGARRADGPTDDAIRAALQAWYEADDLARQAEQRLREASLARETDKTIPIPEHLLREMVRTRAEANARLREAIALSAR